MLLPVELCLDALLETLAALTAIFHPDFIRSLMKHLIDLEALHQLAHSSEVAESEKATIFRIEELKALIDLFFTQVCPETLCTLP